MTARLDFLGAAGTVTGSRSLITTDDARVLVDAGLFQGLRQLRQRNWEPFPVPAEQLDGVAISHAHLDHSGYLPALARQGYRGPVFATAGTTALAGIVLTDSAHLLAEDAEHARAKGYSKHDPPLPLYTDADVESALGLFRPVAYGTEFDLTGGLTGTLAPAGHILGSASVHIRLDDGRTLLFSGDLGRPHHPLLRPPAAPAAADIVVVESTYGDRHHERDGRNLGAAIVRTVKRGGSVIIPAFAVDRTEVILMELRRLREAGEIPAVPVYADSPMALAALRVYRDAVRDHAPEIRSDIELDDDLFDPGDLHELRTVEQSKTINDPSWPCIIVSASGMASGGRVLHHLAGLLPDPANTVILAGYQAVGTRGRDLLDGVQAVKIHGRYVPVRAEVVDVPMFSVHADADEILAWLGSSPSRPEVCYVVHGEPQAAGTMAKRIHAELGWTAVVPRMGERVVL